MELKTNNIEIEKISKCVRCGTNICMYQKLECGHHYCYKCIVMHFIKVKKESTTYEGIICCGANKCNNKEKRIFNKESILGIFYCNYLHNLIN